LPGLDGTGFAALSQFSALGELFEVNCLQLPRASSASFPDLVDAVCDHVAAAQAAHPGRPVVLLGESLGGVVALAAAARCAAGNIKVAHVVLVNPATSFASSPWPVLGPLLPSLPLGVYNAVPFALAPILGDPIRLAASALAGAAEASLTGQQQQTSVAEAAVSSASALLGSLSRLGLLAEILPPETLSCRLQLLADGCRIVDAALNDPATARSLPPTSIFVGDADRLIPSQQEGSRLASKLLLSKLHVIAGGSHMLLQEGSLNLANALRDTGVYRPLAKAAAAAAEPHVVSDAQPLKRRGMRQRNGAVGGIALGAAAMPTQEAIERARQSVALLRRIASPLFFSTSADGSVELGLRHVPVNAPEHPVLFVGNHTTLAPDLGVLIDELLTRKGMLLRGLAHPVLFQQPTTSPLDNRRDSMQQTFQTFGAVPVSGLNLYTLLAAGEAVLLFPGGVREAYKRRGEAYTLHWPSKPEFVRHAIRAGATIVPFASVGIDDSMQLIADADDVLSLPFVGDVLRQRAREMPSARAVDTRTTQDGGSEEFFLPPLVAPNGLPKRCYFLFGKPMRCGEMDASVADDSEAVAALYADVKSGVESSIQYLLQKRDKDPFADTGVRMLWEAAAGRQAATFKP